MSLVEGLYPEKTQFKHGSSKQASGGDMSPEKLRLGPGAKTRAFDVAPEMTISKGDV